jgi:HD-like signal output (HDOD) protein
MDRIGAYRAIAADLGSGELAFPTSAQVALKVRQALDDPQCHIESAVKLVQAEPLLAARVVAVANSAAYNRSGRDIADVRTSVQRLGFGTVRMLATALVTRQLAGTVDAHGSQKWASQLWEHCAHVAALARVIAQRVTQVDAETALFTGIVHEVGGFYLLSRAGQYPGLLDDEKGEWVDFGEAEVGRAVLRVLEVPEPVQLAIADYWKGYLEMPPRTLGDTLLLAEALAPVSSPLREPGNEAMPEGWHAHIDLSLGSETLMGILEASADEVASLTQALRF